jgi:hypothetical protein
MERWNSEGIRLDQLGWALSQRHVVLEYRKLNKCMLCLRENVNEAALCSVCQSLLEPPLLTLTMRWMNGGGP